MPVAKIKEAQQALLERLWAEHKDDMRALTKGDKKFGEDEKIAKFVRNTAKAIAKGYEE